MTATEPENAVPAADERIATIAGAILDAYGADAVLVARRQLDAADDACRADWAAILRHLERR
jgi:hypothetical protein